jgi:hypothetical protein
MIPIFLHDWNSAEEVFADFEDVREWKPEPSHPIADKADVEILFASYTYEDYYGRAFVLYRNKKDGQLYEVNGSHCSCYGLEDQWTPEDTNIAVLRHRIVSGELGRNDNFAAELLAALDELEAAETGEA